CGTVVVRGVAVSACTPFHPAPGAVCAPPPRGGGGGGGGGGGLAPSPPTPLPRGERGDNHTRRFLGGRQPLCGSGVTSSMALMFRPAACRAVMADSRPEPGPLTRTSTSLRPNLAAGRPASRAPACAATGVSLRGPLTPPVPRA